MSRRRMIEWPSLAIFQSRASFLSPNLYDLVAFGLIIAALAMIADAAGRMGAPLTQLDIAPVKLDPALLPEYALRTTLRMFAAMAASLVFTFIVATLAAKSRKAEMVIIPSLDILQSVPVLGFLTFTVLFFLNLFPGSQLGAECAAIFAIFTAQAWNMCFSFYQSLRTIPRDLNEVSRHFGLSPWLRFWRLEVPFAMPGLIWNAMMSMSGSWFFVVASEAISVGDTKIVLPGIGSWLALAVDEQDIPAVGMAVAAFALVIFLYDQLIFRPIVAWSDKFRAENTAAQDRPQSWLYDLIRRTQLLKRLANGLHSLLRLPASIPLPRTGGVAFHLPPLALHVFDLAWFVALFLATGYLLWLGVDYVSATLTLRDALQATGLGLITLVRVLVLLVLASVIWVPIGVWVGLRPQWSTRIQPLAQFLAAFPANVVFPLAVVLIVQLKLDPDIWLSPLMILGTQWYILFNVVAGASALPTDLREVAAMFGMRRWQWWSKVALPGIFPYYITGALTASGGSWNASIVAEVVSWGQTKLQANGLGAYIANATDAGDYPRVVLGVAIMAAFVVLFNQIVWRPLYRFAERRLKLS